MLSVASAASERKGLCPFKFSGESIDQKHEERFPQDLKSAWRSCCHLPLLPQKKLHSKEDDSFDVAVARNSRCRTHRTPNCFPGKGNMPLHLRTGSTKPRFPPSRKKNTRQKQQICAAPSRAWCTNPQSIL